MGQFMGCVFEIPIALSLCVVAEVSVFKGIKRDEPLGIRSADFMKHEFRYLNVSRVGTAQVSEPMDCGLACLEIAACFSFNVASPSGAVDGKLQCELLATHKYNASEKLEESLMFHHYSVYTGCFKNPCQNGGKCVVVYKGEPAEDHCECAEGYTGKYCEADIDECASAGHCHSSAVCVNTPGSYSCSCEQPFSADGNGSCTMEDSGCQSYSNLTDADRNSTYDGGVKICDRDVISAGWYRFQGPAGTRMPTACVPTQRCNTHAPGWLDGEHPSAAEGVVQARACFHWYSSCCHWSNNIAVRNCGNYYVYYLVPPRVCRLRYCGTE